MTHDEREKLSRTQESLAGLHRQLQEANRDTRTARMRLAWALAGIMVCLLVMGLYWPVQRECATVEAMSQERMGDLEAMRAGVGWYRGQVSYWEGQAARRVAAERELAEVLASRVKWHTAGIGPLDLPPLRLDSPAVTKRLIAYEGELALKEETLVEPVSISQQVIRALGSEAMKAMRLMVRP